MEEDEVAGKSDFIKQYLENQRKKLIMERETIKKMSGENFNFCAICLIYSDIL